MSSEPDYNFNQPAPSTSEGLSLHLPFALLTATLAVILVAQTVNVFKVRGNLREGKAQIADAMRNSDPMVKQSGAIQQKLQELVLDLLTLAKTDDDAKAIVNKYGIQQGAQPSSSEPAPAADAPK